MSARNNVMPHKLALRELEDGATKNEKELTHGASSESSNDLGDVGAKPEETPRPGAPRRAVLSTFAMMAVALAGMGPAVPPRSRRDDFDVPVRSYKPGLIGRTSGRYIMTRDITTLDHGSSERVTSNAVLSAREKRARKAAKRALDEQRRCAGMTARLAHDAAPAAPPPIQETAPPDTSEPSA